MADLYKSLLKQHGLYDQALENYSAGSVIFGGISDEDTLLHFVARYLSAATRVQYLVLNPRGEFRPIQEDLISILSDGQINILNIPCGTGSDIMSLLIMLTVLRSKKLLTSNSLNLRITAGDISPKALEIYRQFIEGAKPILRQQGIVIIECKTFAWDAAKENMTSDLMDHLLHHDHVPKEYLALYSAFSGAGKSLKKQFERSIQHIESRLDKKKSTTLWIEPKGSGAEFVQGILKTLKSLAWFARTKENSSEATFNWRHPFTKKEITGNMYIIKHSSPCHDET